MTQQMIDEVVGSGECKSISDAILLADKARWPDDEGVFWVPENCYMATITEIQRLEALLYPDLATHHAEIAQNAEAAKRLEAADALLRECDAVARMRGDKYGLCDEVDNYGNPYQSEYLEKHLQEPTDRRTPEGE